VPLQCKPPSMGPITARGVDGGSDIYFLGFFYGFCRIQVMDFRVLLIC